MIHSLEHFAASASHLALYFFMAALPSTGIAMGYYGGKGESCEACLPQVRMLILS